MEKNMVETTNQLLLLSLYSLIVSADPSRMLGERAGEGLP